MMKNMKYEGLGRCDNSHSTLLTCTAAKHLFEPVAVEWVVVVVLVVVVGWFDFKCVCAISDRLCLICDLWEG